MKNLRVVFLSSNLGQGGAEQQLFYILKTLVNLGVKPRLLSWVQSGYWERPIRDLGIEIYWVGQNNTIESKLFRIIKILQKDPCDIIQCQHFSENLYSTIAARLIRSREIGAIRSNTYYELNDTGPILGKLSLLMPRLIAVNSIRGIQNAMKLGKKRDQLFYLPNAVDPNNFKPMNMQRDPKKFIVAYIGTLRQPKRVDRFLRVANLCKKESMIEFWIFGDGEFKTKLFDYAQTLGVSDKNVIFHDRRDNKEIYQNIDLLLLTSDYEGTPNVILEAMSSGLPVISTNIGDAGNLIHDGTTGFLFECNEEQKIAEKIIALEKDRSLCKRIGNAGRIDVLSRFNLDLLRRNLFKLYERALARSF